jgi:hypothetical protein
MKTLQEMSATEYEAVMDRFIEKAAQWDGSLPIETFFEAWAEIERHKANLQVQAQIKGNQLVLTAPPDSPLVVQGNQIRLEDGRQVTIQLILAPTAG